MLIWLQKVEHHKKIYINFLKTYKKMKETIIKFVDIEIQKQRFHQHKGPISIKKM